MLFGKNFGAKIMLLGKNFGAEFMLLGKNLEQSLCCWEHFGPEFILWGKFLGKVYAVGDKSWSRVYTVK
jgi:hypothetical protein